MPFYVEGGGNHQATGNRLVLAGGLMLITFIFLLATVQAGPVQPVSAVDLDRYIGRWHEIARYPNRFQKDCRGDVTATYELTEDGRLRILNRCVDAAGRIVEAEGVARVVKGSNNARLKVRFAPGWIGWLPFVCGDYWVIGLSRDYTWAVVGTPDRKYLWVLAREPELSYEDWAAATTTAQENGFDISALVRSR